MHAKMHEDDGYDELHLVSTFHPYSDITKTYTAIKERLKFTIRAK